MRLAKLFCIISILVLVGCGGNEKPNTLNQINDTCMYISSDPIHLESTVVFEVRPTEAALQNIEKWFGVETGPAGVSIHLDDGRTVEPSQMRVRSRIERTISVQQAGVALYGSKQIITKTNLHSTAPVLLKSTEWDAAIQSDGGDVQFKVEYRRHWELEEFGGGVSVIRSDSCSIPIQKKD